ncbi:hypothetical protein [Pacificoceanicola onchidii]|uniref:hypothetical protein n=1 Tax=Pacificoceanicola onchidii TaxID=2562685 RepID=UPI0010A5B57D|nr:hypothetical protein [Pacificoceanicola onchidii]
MTLPDPDVVVSVRQGMIWAVESLVDFEETLNALGFSGYFEMMFDWFPYSDTPEPIDQGALSEAELAAMERVRSVIGAASDATPNDMVQADFIATGWPQRVAVVAKQAILVFREGEPADDAVPALGRKPPRPPSHQRTPVKRS